MRLEKFINESDKFEMKAKDLHVGIVEVQFYKNGSNFGWPITINQSQLKSVIGFVVFDKDIQVTQDQVEKLKKMG